MWALVSKSRATGTKWETAVARYMSERLGWTVRRTGSRSYEKGDIEPDDIPWLVVECKDDKAIDLAGWIKQVEKAVLRVDLGRFGWVVSKRRMKGVSQSYVVMTLEDAVDLYSIALHAVAPGMAHRLRSESPWLGGQPS